MKRIFLAVAFLVPTFLPANGQVRITTGAPPLPRQLEKLDRGVVAVHSGDGKVFVSWWFTAADPDDIAFNM
jgi:Rhamnogalacturonan I lyases beta-sheet domain